MHEISRRPRIHYFGVNDARDNQKVMYRQTWQLKPPGKPSTWFPGEESVTQNLIVSFSAQCDVFIFSNVMETLDMSFMSFLKFAELDLQTCLPYESSLVI